MNILRYRFFIYIRHLLLSILIYLFNIDEAFPQLPADSLHNIGHASMKIKTADGKIIYIDPYQTPGDYSDSADIILVTHSHQDHNNISLVTQKSTCTVITYAEANLSGEFQTFNVDNIKIYSVAAYSVNSQNHNRNQCVGYIVEFNGIKLYHAGDTDNIPEMADLADSNITYALLPIDGVFNMGAEEATQAANAIQADFSIPMHTEATPDDFNEGNVNLFTPSNKLVVRHGETIALTSPSTNVEKNKVPVEFRLEQSYPNPFNPSTTINFSIPNSSFVFLKIYDINGKEVAVIIRKELPEGNHSIKWNAAGLSSGVYFYRLEAGNFSATKKLLLLK
ncbi:MAG: MBL fold metallo-hydrolase [Ignavibacteria bacterium]